MIELIELWMIRVTSGEWYSEKIVGLVKGGKQEE